MTLTSALPWIAGLIGGGGIGALIKHWLDHKAGHRKQTDEVAMQLVGRLESRVEKLEADLVDERQRCDRKLAELEAESRVLRHRTNNQRQLIYSLLLLFDVPARQRKEALARVQEQVAGLEQAEALEKGMVATAAIREAGE